jgi:hypothetical protein
LNSPKVIKCGTNLGRNPVQGIRSSLPPFTLNLIFYFRYLYHLHSYQRIAKRCRQWAKNLEEGLLRSLLCVFSWLQKYLLTLFS